jgi:hypothetical protein
VIAVGGSLNPNRHKVAVPFDALQCSPDEKEMMISATREQLESAPKAASGEWAVVNGATWTRNVDAYYGQPVPAERRKVAQKIPPKGAELLSPPQDTVLSEKICESLDVVTVRVQDGVAHIHGTVESDKERQAIESKIRSIQGVSRVESHVKVKG